MSRDYDTLRLCELNEREVVACSCSCQHHIFGKSATAISRLSLDTAFLDIPCLPYMYVYIFNYTYMCMICMFVLHLLGGYLTLRGRAWFPGDQPVLFFPIGILLHSDAAKQ